MTVLARNTLRNETIFQLVSKPLIEADLDLQVVDVGARNGMFLLPAEYTSLVTLIGFEPNPEEYEKLANGTTDMHKWSSEHGSEIPKFKKERFFDCAVWDKEGGHTLYITEGAGACTLMGETLPVMQNTYYMYPGNDPKREKSLYDLQMRVVSEAQVRCRTLDDVLKSDQNDQKIDFLKVDVEGGELRVFEGAKNLLDQKKVLFIQAEFQAFSYYENHPVFGEQQAFLNQKGMRLIDLNLDHPRYQRGGVGIPDACDRSPIFAGDALYMIDPDRNDLSALDRQRLALILLVFDFNSLAMSLLVEANLLSKDELSAISTAIKASPDKTKKRQLLDAWSRIPVVIYEKLSFARNLLRKFR